MYMTRRTFRKVAHTGEPLLAAAAKAMPDVEPAESKPEKRAKVSLDFSHDATPAEIQRAVENNRDRHSTVRSWRIRRCRRRSC